MPSSGCLLLILSATRPPEELTLSPKLQLDGGLTISSSSSLQASPRGLLPGLLPGPADKLTPKGPGQVRVGVCVQCTVAGLWQWEDWQQSPSTACSCLRVLLCLRWPIFPLRSSQPSIILRGQILSLFITTSSPPGLWPFLIYIPLPYCPIFHHCKHQCFIPVFPYFPYFPPPQIPSLVHHRCLLLPLHSPWSYRKWSPWGYPRLPQLAPAPLMSSPQLPLPYPRISLRLRLKHCPVALVPLLLRA